MKVDVFRFEFTPTVPLADAELTLQLAMIAAEGLVGKARVCLDASYHVDGPRWAIIVDGTNIVGAIIVRIFVGLLNREFGEDAFAVRRTTVPDFVAEVVIEMTPARA